MDSYLLSLLITFLYATICFSSLIQLARILYYRHNVKSFHFAFLLLTFFWSFLRILFFGITSSIPSLVALLLFWFPGDFQFASFSLIVVFHDFLLNRHIWFTRRHWILSLYALLNGSIFLFTALFIYVSCFHTGHSAAAAAGQCVVTERLERTHHVYVFLQFCLLLSVYAISIYNLHLQSGRLFSSLTALSVFVWFCFFTRCLYCLLAALGIYSIEIGGDSGGLKEISLLSSFLLLFWEILPMLLFLIYFRHIPPTRARDVRSMRSNSNATIRTNDSSPFDSSSESASSRPSPSEGEFPFTERSALLQSATKRKNPYQYFRAHSQSNASPVSALRDLDQELLAEYYGYGGPNNSLNTSDLDSSGDLDAIFHPLRIPPMSYSTFAASSSHYSGSPLPDSYAAFDGPLDVDPALIPPFHSHLFASNLYHNVNDQYFRNNQAAAAAAVNTGISVNGHDASASVPVIPNPDASTGPVAIQQPAETKKDPNTKPLTDYLYGDNGVHSVSDHE